MSEHLSWNKSKRGNKIMTLNICPYVKVDENCKNMYTRSDHPFNEHLIAVFTRHPIAFFYRQHLVLHLLFVWW